MAFAAGIAGLANLAWAAAWPGRAAPSGWVAVAGALTAGGSLALRLHPRARGFRERGGRAPLALPPVLAALLQPPRTGPELWGFLWTFALLTFVWLRAGVLAETLVPVTEGAGGPPAPAPGRRGRAPRDPARRAAQALPGTLAGVAAFVVLLDLAAGGAPNAAGARVALGALAGAPALALGALAARGAALRRAEGDGAQVQSDFQRRWWWAVAPAVPVCLLLGLIWPHYRAPLQSGLVQRLVVAAVARLGAPPAHARPSGFGGGDAAWITGLCLGVLVAAWPGRRPLQRVAARFLGTPSLDAGASIGWATRLRRWWQRLVDRWLALRGRRRRRPVGHGTWRPLAVRAQRPVASPAPEATRPGGPGADHRWRVRRAYATFLQAAAAAGLRRPAGSTPRRYLGWLLPRARPVRFPLQSLTGAYEEARFSPHPLDAAAAARAEGDARAAVLALEIARREQPGQPPLPSTLHWTPPRGVGPRRRRPDGGGRGT